MIILILISLVFWACAVYFFRLRKVHGDGSVKLLDEMRRSLFTGPTKHCSGCRSAAPLNSIRSAFSFSS